MDAAQWPQGVGVVRAAENSRNSEKKTRPEKEQALNCPRCNSINTKFCYYNNYSLSQPRYFCKTCRRYWTAGGTLRNIPVGGSSRKNKRAPSSSTPSISTHKLISSDLNSPKFPPRNPNIHDGHEPNLSYNGISDLVASPFMVQAHNLNPQNPNSDIFPVSNSNSVISSGFPMHEPEPSSGFSFENRFQNSQPAAVRDDPTTASRIAFPFEESSNYEFENDRGLQRDCSGFWSGMISGGSW